MPCPQCGFENLMGEDTCDNCGADLAGRDTPQSATTYRGPMLGEHLDELEVGEPEIVDITADAAEAVRRMHDNGTDCVLVVDDGKLVGIFTDRDAVLKVAGRPLEKRPIAELMTHDPVVLRLHDDTIAVAIHKMAVGGFRHIPIVEHGRPTGLVSARDVFRHLARSRSAEAARSMPDKRVLVLADDLIWSTRLVGHVRAAGAETVPVRTLAALDAGLPGADAVVVDLTAMAYDGIEAIRRASSAGRRILAVGQHDDLDLRRRALDAGAERVHPYRKLFEDGPATLAEWLDGPVEASAR